jgi:peptide/nickel transport system ATP-binding protein
MALLEIEDLWVRFPGVRGPIESVRSLDLSVGREKLGIVGESGSGKSTLVRTLIGLEQATHGDAFYRGDSLIHASREARDVARRQIQMVFQDPTASLNPRMTVQEIISEPWAIHPDALPRREWIARVGDLLEQVGLLREHAGRYPHQFSGGQRQRIAIARALALKPAIIICDEAVSSLDVSVQAQVIALLKSLKDEFGLSYLFIAHDLPVVRSFADRVLVMHKGIIVEQGPTRQIFTDPQHLYTRELLHSDPVLSLGSAAWPRPGCRRRVLPDVLYPRPFASATKP